MIAKIIQNIANDVEFGKKEPFMEPFNPTIAEYKPMYQAFLRNLVCSFHYNLLIFSLRSTLLKTYNP